MSKRAITTRLMGAEVEYLGSSRDKAFDFVNEYYRDMREVNSILLPCSDVLASLKVLKDIMLNIDDSIHNKLGTYGWVNSYGIAYNGVHLHLSGKIDAGALERNIFRVIHRHGLSPRTVTSWHIFNRPTRYNLKNKRKHVPIYKTPRGTLEIRILDIEYFMDDEIIVDIAEAIEFAYAGKDTKGNHKWVDDLMRIGMEDYKKCCDYLDTNMAKWWRKNSEGRYTNTNGNYTFAFKDLEDWEVPEEMPEEDDTVADLEEAMRGLHIGRRRGPEIRMESTSSSGDLWTRAGYDNLGSFSTSDTTTEERGE